MSAIFLIILATSAFFTLTMRPVYSATVNLMIDKPGAKLLSKADSEADKADRYEGSLDASIIETEVEVLRSLALAEAVAGDLQLARDPEFNPALSPPNWIARLRGAVSERLKWASDAPKGKPRNPVAEALESHLKVSRVGTSYIIRLEITSHDPEKAARIANAFAGSYLRSQLAVKFDTSRQANSWLYSRIGEIRQRVVAAETALQNYKIQNNLMSAAGATLAEQEISALDQQVSLTRAQEAEAQARLSTAQSQLAAGSAGDDVGEALNSPVIQQLRSQRAVVSQRVANLQTRYGDRHPELLKSRGELADIDAQIHGEIQRIMSNLQAQRSVARERGASMEQSAGRSRQELAQNNRSMVHLNELQRNADAERALYESFLSKFKELTAEAGLAQSDAHIVSPARAPSAPSAPRKSLNLALGAFLGMAAAITTALGVEMVARGVADAEVVEKELGVSYLGSIPSLDSVAAANDPLRNKPADHLLAKPISSFAEAFRSLNAAIEFSRPEGNVKVLAVTSSLPGEGKTTTAVGLARSAAMSGLRTVVVDCDLRQRAVDNVLKISPAIGLLEVLNGTASLNEALLLDEASGAMILPLVRSHFTAKDTFSSVAMSRLITELRRGFDLVVLDTPPVILVTDARSIARQADLVLLLVHWRKTPRSLVLTALRMLHASGAAMAGIALTRVDVRRTASVDPDDPAAFYLTHKKYYQR
ncbi:MAG: lipopolysaccharide biosynthesis protein [Phenylobacterium sp.]|nr:lipopolysaccharide biosynthesis protein [Phenylobacterium sp.]